MNKKSSVSRKSSRVPHPSVFEGWDSTSAGRLDSFGSPALTLAFGDDGELHAEGVQDGIDGFEARVCARA